jgi:hypothetical protein
MAVIDMDALPQCLMDETFVRTPGAPLYIANANPNRYLRIEIHIPDGYATPGGASYLYFDDVAYGQCWHLDDGNPVPQGYAESVYTGPLFNGAGMKVIISLDPSIEGGQFVTAKAHAPRGVLMWNMMSFRAGSWSKLSWVCAQSAAGTVRAWMSPRPMG